MHFTSVDADSKLSRTIQIIVSVLELFAHNLISLFQLFGRYQSKAELEEIENDNAKWAVIKATSNEVHALIASWEKDGYPEKYSLCEKAVGDVIRANGVLDTFKTTARQSNGRILAVEYFLKDVRAILRQQEREREKQKAALLQGRASVEEGMYRNSSQLGEFVMFPKQGRVLVCISCEFVRAPRDMGQDDDGYYCKYAEPTEEEQATPRYQAVLKTMQDNIEYEARAKARIEAQRAADLAVLEANKDNMSEEDIFFAELFAGTSDN